eukprot:1139731-Pelagomonas_calceolata.AAC.4
MCAWGQTDRHGVLISNYVEDGAKVDFASSGKHLLGFGEPFRATSTHAADYNPERELQCMIPFSNPPGPNNTCRTEVPMDRDMVKNGVSIIQSHCPWSNSAELTRNY